MIRASIKLILLLLTIGSSGYAQAVQTESDSSPHTVSFVTVDKDVKLEVLDWGGSGRAIVLLSGLGNTAHVFDDFAPKLTVRGFWGGTQCPPHHVYGITRRGFGASSSPPPSDGNYSAERLGDDVLAVIDSLKLDRPVLVGHSIAGEELSSVGSRYPDRVAGLIYLDAGYSYAYYDATRGDLLLDSLDLRRKLDGLLPGPQDQKELVNELPQTDIPRFQKDLQDQPERIALMPARTQQPREVPPVVRAIFSGEQKFTKIPVPILAIFAVPHDLRPMFEDNPGALAPAEALDAKETGAQAKAFESGLPSALVVRLPNADHFVFRSNEADVLREMNAFLSKLPQFSTRKS